MPPIRADQLPRYPPEWSLISAWVRFERALGRCECLGDCGGALHGIWAEEIPGGPHRCPNYHGDRSRFTGARVVLTTAHLNHIPEDCRPENLRAMCQACHLAYDREHHAETRAGR